MTIRDLLFSKQDPAYADFQSKLTPTLPRETFIGVRVPELRKTAKEISGLPETEEFLRTLPHRYYDENMLHALLLSLEKDFAKAVEQTEAFLPFVDNWAVCDVLSPRVFARHKSELLPKIREWAASPLTYTCRFGVEMLMSHFLDADFDPALLEIPATIVSGEYYVNMMLAWFFATALTKQWDAAVPFLEQNRLPVWVHNKTVQKARESYRISAPQKEYLLSLRR